MLLECIPLIDLHFFTSSSTQVTYLDEFPAARAKRHVHYCL